MNQSKLPYRPEIDGLRALAVLSVIFYHAQIVLLGRDWFKGGYIGVDIFLVISGYLITRIILSELQANGSFSFLTFYERRARRILPMLITIIIVTIPFALYSLIPSDLIEFSQSGLSSLYFGSNFFFYSITTAYGAESALLKPFLHTWSLSVEEQFYIVFPVIAIIAFKFFRAHILTVIVALLLLSLHFADVMEAKNPDLNFFFPFGRFWELAAGGALAYIEIHYKTTVNSISRQVFPIIGLYLVAYSILYFDHKTPHPSFQTLIPVVGTALIIAFGSKDDLVGKLLGSRPFVWVGLISYSLYLWHFPILAISRVRDSSLSNFDKLELLIATLALSIISYFIIEKPMRRYLSRKAFFAVIIIFTSILVGILSYVGYSKEFEKHWLKYAPSELATPYKMIMDRHSGAPKINHQCQFNVLKNDSSFDFKERINECRKQFGNAVFILGDSHGLNIYRSFLYNNRNPFIVGSVQGGCQPYYCLKNRPNNYDFFKKEILPLIKPTDNIVFHQSGSHLLLDQDGSNNPIRVFDEGVYSIDTKSIDQIQSYLSSIASNTKANLIWLGPFLEYRHNIKDIFQTSMKGESIEKYLSVKKNSPIIFSDLEKSLESLDPINFKFIPFSSFYRVSPKSLIENQDGENCFQFQDSNHFSDCGVFLISQRANFPLIGLQ